MSQTQQVTGAIVEIASTQQVSEKFKKREFVLALTEQVNGNTYTNYAKMQLTQNKVEIIDRFKVGDTVTVSYNITGNKWEKDGKINYITSLSVWRIDGATAEARAGAYVASTSGTYAGGQPVESVETTANGFKRTLETIDDLPF